MLEIFNLTALFLPSLLFIMIGIVFMVFTVKVMLHKVKLGLKDRLAIQIILLFGMDVMGALQLLTGALILNQLLVVFLIPFFIALIYTIGFIFWRKRVIRKERSGTDTQT